MSMNLVKNIKKHTNKKTMKKISNVVKNTSVAIVGVELASIIYAKLYSIHIANTWKMK